MGRHRVPPKSSRHRRVERGVPVFAVDWRGLADSTTTRLRAVVEVVPPSRRRLVGVVSAAALFPVLAFSAASVPHVTVPALLHPNDVAPVESVMVPEVSRMSDSPGILQVALRSAQIPLEPDKHDGGHDRDNDGDRGGHHRDRSDRDKHESHESHDSNDRSNSDPDEHCK